MIQTLQILRYSIQATPVLYKKTAYFFKHTLQVSYNTVCSFMGMGTRLSLISFLDYNIF